MKVLNITLIILLGAQYSFSQEEKSKNPNVELPEFVITGSDLISVQQSTKIKPEVLPVLTNRFLTPSFSPEDLQIGDLAGPVKNQINLADSLDYFSGKLEAGAGIYTIPKILFTLSSPFENGIFQVYALGKNQRSYVKKSERYNLNAGLDLFYQLESESKFFNGTKFQAHADYGRLSYQLFAANDIDIKRNLNKGYVAFNIENLLEDQINYSLKFSDDIHSLQDNIYSENFINMDANFRWRISNFNIGLNASYKVQYLSNNIVQKAVKDFVYFKPFIGFSILNNYKAAVGINYSYYNEPKVYPFIYFGAKVNNQFSVFGEYSPQTFFLGNGHFLDLNPYFYIHNFVHTVYESKSAIHFAAKYEYNKYYEINGGIKYFSSPTLPYFESSALKGRFNISKESAKSYTAYANLLFHLGPYGYFYSSVELNETKSESGKILPYYPAINSYFTYGYNFDFGLNADLTLKYLSKQYIDLQNSETISPSVNLGSNLIYKISDQFNLKLELNNLLNRKNYFWSGYQEMLLDVVFGAIFRW